MRRLLRGPAALLIALGMFAVPGLFGVGAGAQEPAEVREAFRFADPEITESSGLVDRDGLFVTVNDSGDAARVFTVDPATGETVGVTTYAEEVVDVEALAPVAGEDAAVWVGDIGANTGPRESVTVYRVPVGAGDREVEAPAYELVYPGGRTPDAESLLVDPRSGRLLVLTKEVFGGTLYEAPASLDADAPNRLRQVSEQTLTGIATDASFLPDGRHLVVRNYETAVFYSWPGLESVGEIDLPEQPQGEAISVAEDGRIHISTEGPLTPVLFIALPADLRALLEAPPRPSASPTGPTIIETPEGFEPPEPDTGGAGLGPGRGNWLVGGLLGVVVVVVLLRALRPR